MQVRPHEFYSSLSSIPLEGSRGFMYVIVCETGSTGGVFFPFVKCAQFLKSHKSIFVGCTKYRPSDERWGAGVEYHFPEFNEPNAPS